MEKGWLKNKTVNGIKPINLKMVEQCLSHASRQEEKWDSSLTKAIRKLPIIIGRKSEPFCSYEEKYSATYLTLRLIANYGFKAVVETRQTKGVLEALSKVEVAGANLSILFGDDSVRKRMEPELPTYEDRFELARKLKSIGLHVGLIAEPLIPTLNDKPEFYEAYAEKASEIGVDHVNFGELRVQNIKIAAEMFSDGGLDLIEVVRGKEHWKEDGLKIFESFKSRGVKISTPDWVNFYSMNDCRGCCGLDKFGLHYFTFQHALDLLKQKDAKITFDDMLKYNIFDLKEEERFRKIWNGDSRYYNLADVEGIKKSNNSHGVRYEKEN
jgi:DNA repair photolyase